MAILGIALALRLAHWAAVRRAPFIGQLAMDSWEYDRWAREIAAGDWLGHARGVFFQAPLYPYLLAILFAAIGPHLDAAYLVQIALAVAGCYALYRAGRAMAGERVGLAAAALAAVYGPFVFYDVQLLKESLAVTAVCFLLWAMASFVRGDVGRWLVTGLLLGILALLRENALLVAPFLLPLAWSAGLATAARRTGRVAAFLAGIALALAPVGLRNGLVGGAFLPTTSQGGVNFYIGNNPRADGTYRPIVPGKQTPELERREPARVAEQQLGRRLSSAEVSRYWLRRALAWAGSHPGDFLRLTLRKLGMFWSWYEWPDAVDYYYIRGLSPVYRLPLLEFGGVTLLAALGLGFLRGGRGWRLVPALLFAAAWMVSTVAFFLFARYRLPAVPALLLLAALPVAAFVEAAESWWQARAAVAGRPAAASGPAAASSRAAVAIESPASGVRAPEDGERVPAGGEWVPVRRPALRAGGLGLAVIAALVLPRLAGFGPRLDLVSFNLGRLAEERGDAAGAQGHYQAALAAAPDAFLAWLDLGNLAARRRDWPAALRCYQRAAVLEPESDDAESNLGGVYLALGDLAASSRHLQRALALNASSAQALQNGALLRLRLGDVQAARELNRRTLEIEPGNPSALRLRARLAALAR
ncbi:MAG TPA: glycosyltransferase family 39 protein [Thermoanaerobaculia bacterium]|nr:glycosyltransferase family 39 protein [Thermoanaerobaculia bacterium]